MAQEWLHQSFLFVAYQSHPVKLSVTVPVSSLQSLTAVRIGISLLNKLAVGKYSGVHSNFVFALRNSIAGWEGTAVSAPGGCSDGGYNGGGCCGGCSSILPK